MLYCCSKPVGFWFGWWDPNATVETGDPLERLVLSSMIVIGLCVLARRSVNWRMAFQENTWLVVLFAYMLISIVWSDFPFVSFKRWVKTAGTLVMAMIVLSEARPYDSLRSLFLRISYVLIPLSMVLVKYFPHLGVQFAQWSGGRMWCGATLAKNSLGVLCYISAVFLIWMLSRRLQGKEPLYSRSHMFADLLVLSLTFVLMIGPGGSYSATSIAALMVSMGIFFSLRRLERIQYLNKVWGAGVLGVCVILLVVRLLQVSPLGLVATMLGREETLTGRTDLIWSVLVPLAWKHPILGVGYGAFWIVPVPEFNFPINEAHNGYLDVFIELGATGLALLFFLVISFFNKARREFEHNRDWASLQIAFLATLILHNFTESDFLRSTFPFWNMFILLMIVHPWEYAIAQTRPALISGDWGRPRL
jgi:O-antigen ligase